MLVLAVGLGLVAGAEADRRDVQLVDQHTARGTHAEPVEAPLAEPGRGGHPAADNTWRERSTSGSNGPVLRGAVTRRTMAVSPV